MEAGTARETIDTRIVSRRSARSSLRGHQPPPHCEPTEEMRTRRKRERAKPVTMRPWPGPTVSPTSTPTVTRSSARSVSEGGDFWAWRDSMLELASAQTPETVREEYEATYRGDGGRRVRRSRRVPLPGARGGASRCRSGGRGPDRARPAALGVRARRPGLHAPEIGCGVFRAGRTAQGRKEFASASPPTPSVPAHATGWTRLAGMRARTTSSSTSTRTSSHARSRSAWPSTR